MSLFKVFLGERHHWLEAVIQKLTAKRSVHPRRAGDQNVNRTRFLSLLQGDLTQALNATGDNLRRGRGREIQKISDFLKLFPIRQIVNAETLHLGSSLELRQIDYVLLFHFSTPDLSGEIPLTEIPRKGYWAE